MSSGLIEQDVQVKEDAIPGGNAVQTFEEKMPCLLIKKNVQKTVQVCFSSSHTTGTQVQYLKSERQTKHSFLAT